MGLYKKQQNEDIIYKVIIDVLGNYLSETDGPHYQVILRLTRLDLS